MNKFMTVVWIIAGIAMIWTIYFHFVRATVVYNARRKAIDVIHDHDLSYREYLDNPNYDQMMAQHKRWTFKHFYPHLYFIKEWKKGNCEKT